MKKRIVLASQSPRRKEILTAAGIAHSVRAAAVEEVRRADESPEDYVRRLAREKSGAVELEEGEIILSADTVVVLDGQVLEKPAGQEDAIRMLEMLAGRGHAVMTGICLRTEAHEVVDLAVTRVQFSPMSRKEIVEYAASGEPSDKAGGYAIQGRASKFVERIEGCYFNVVGLPVALVYRRLVELGWES